MRAVRTAALSGVVGAVAGLTSSAFLVSLSWAAGVRDAHPSYIFFLPLAGLAAGLLATRAGRGVPAATSAVLERTEDPQGSVAPRLAVVTFLGSVISHLGGASIGREGAAVQIAASAVDAPAARLGLGARDRMTLASAAVAGGFGSVLGVPVAGAVFALESRRVRDGRVAVLVPALVASIAGHRVVGLVGVEHTVFPSAGRPGPGLGVLGASVLIGVASGVSARLFRRGVAAVRAVLARFVAAEHLRPLAGGCVAAVLVVAFSWREHSGLSVPLASAAFEGGTAGNFVAKLGLTALAAGSGFIGGEFTPVFVSGALLGATTGQFVHVAVPLAAMTGSVALLAAVTGTPLTMLVVGLELFGAGSMLPFALAVAAAAATGGRGGTYRRA